MSDTLSLLIVVVTCIVSAYVVGGSTRVERWARLIVLAVAIFIAATVVILLGAEVVR